MSQDSNQDKKGAAVQEHLDRAEAARQEELLRFAVGSIPSVSPDHVDEIVVALKISGVTVQPNGAIPLLSTAIKSLAYRQPSLFRQMAPGVVVDSREELEKLFGRKSSAKYSNELAISDIKCWRAMHARAKALGII